MTRNDEIRAVLPGLDFVPTDREIDEALAAEPCIEHQAKWWGWGDSEVRTMLADELQRVHEWTDLMLAALCCRHGCGRQAESLAFDEGVGELIPVCRRHILVYRISVGLWQAEDEYAGLRFARRSRFRWLARWLLLLDQRAAQRGRVSRGQARLIRRRDRQGVAR